MNREQVVEFFELRDKYRSLMNTQEALIRSTCARVHGNDADTLERYAYEVSAASIEALRELGAFEIPIWCVTDSPSALIHQARRAAAVKIIMACEDERIRNPSNKLIKVTIRATRKE
jgi:hypothetical protein